MRSKKAQFNFVLIFAVIAGGAILALAIYSAVSIGDSQRFQTDTMLAQKVSILLDPMQAGFADASYGAIEFNQETRINNMCYFEKLGESRISLSSKSNVGQEWIDAGIESASANKYIFSERSEQGKKMHVFSKPFDFPYKIADLLFVSSRHYCLIEPPQSVEDELFELEMRNIQISESEDGCDRGSLSVCFDAGACDINVHGLCAYGCKDSFEYGYVEKSREESYYLGSSLMYGAIFSDRDIYECNVKRLLYRGKEIAEIYAKKSDLMNARGCSTNMKQQIISFGDLLGSVEPEEIISLKSVMEELRESNEKELCGLW